MKSWQPLARVPGNAREAPDLIRMDSTLMLTAAIITGLKFLKFLPPGAGIRTSSLPSW